MCRAPERGFVIEVQVLNCTTADKSSPVLRKLENRSNLETSAESGQVRLSKSPELYVDMQEIRKAAIPFEATYPRASVRLEDDEIYSMEVATAPVAFVFRGTNCTALPRGAVIRGFINEPCCDVYPPSGLACSFGLNRIDDAPIRSDLAMALLNRANRGPATEQRYYEAILSRSLSENSIVILGAITKVPNRENPTRDGNSWPVSIVAEAILKHTRIENPYIDQLIAPNSEVPVIVRPHDPRKGGPIAIGHRAIWILRYYNNTLWADDFPGGAPASAVGIVRGIIAKQETEKKKLPSLPVSPP